MASGRNLRENHLCELLCAVRIGVRVVRIRVCVSVRMRFVNCVSVRVVRVCVVLFPCFVSAMMVVMMVMDEAVRVVVLVLVAHDHT